MYDEALFLRTMTDFAETLVRRHDPDVVLGEFLQRVCAVHKLSGTAFTVAIEGELQFGVASPSGGQFEQLAGNNRCGPSVDAFSSNESVTYEDVRTETHRWPQYADAALKVGVLGGACIPLRLAEGQVGVLNLYADTARGWSVGDIAAARVLADIATVYLGNASRLAQYPQRNAHNGYRDVAARRLPTAALRRTTATVLTVARPQRVGRTAFPAGTVRGEQPGDGRVHAIDGDGSSFCELHAKDVLVRLDRVVWSDVSRAHRCGRCQTFLSALAEG